MGNSEPPIEEIKTAIGQLRKTIPSDRYFEFGDDPEILSKIEVHLTRVRDSLGQLLTAGDESRSLKDSNPVFATIRVASAAQQFIGAVRKSGVGSRDHTLELLEFINKLEEETARLGNPLGGSSAVAGPHRKHEENPSPEARSFNSTTPIPSFPDQQRATALGSHQPSKRAGGVTKRTSFPKAIGDFVFDIIGRKDTRPTSPAIMGWSVIVIITLIVVIVASILFGVLNSTALVSSFKEIWRFFNPVKPSSLLPTLQALAQPLVSIDHAAGFGSKREFSMMFTARRLSPLLL